MSDSDSPINLTAFGGVFSQPSHVKALIGFLQLYPGSIEVFANVHLVCIRWPKTDRRQAAICRG
jgi:hypothetical protein